MKMRREIIYLNENGVISADSIPDLDDWGWDSFWGCDEWVKWHKALRQKYGLESANQIFAEWWNKQTFGAHALGCRTIDSDFRTYVRSVGLWEIVWQGAEGLKYLLKPIGTVIQTGEVIGTGAARGLQTAGKGLKFLIPIATIALLVGLGIYGYRMVTRKKV